MLMTLERVPVRSQMLFSHDTEVALQAAAALVNTADGQSEQLPDMTALDQFVRTWGWTGKRRRTAAELRAVQDLRPWLRRFWVAGRPGGDEPGGGPHGPARSTGSLTDDSACLRKRIGTCPIETTVNRGKRGGHRGFQQCDTEGRRGIPAATTTGAAA